MYLHIYFVTIVNKSGGDDVMKGFRKVMVAFGVVLCAGIVITFSVPAKAATAEDLANQARWQADQEAQAALYASQVAAYNAENAKNQARWEADQEAQAAENAKNQARWQADQEAQAALYASQVAAYNAENAKNQARWLADQEAQIKLFATQKLNNLKETARIKKEIVTNYVELSKVNPSFAGKIPSAMEDYEAALEAVASYKGSMRL